MRYRVRFTMTDGATALWACDYPTREDAQEAIDDRRGYSGFAYAVEEVPDAPEPGSTAAHHVEILRSRVKELEALVEARGKAVTEAHLANQAMHRDLAFAIHIGDAMREAMRTGEWRSGHDRSMALSAFAGWNRWRPSLDPDQGVLVAASEAPREGGDSDRRRLEALERYLEGNTFRRIWKTSMVTAGTKFEDEHFAAPTLAALADKLAEREAKP